MTFPLEIRKMPGPRPFPPRVNSHTEAFWLGLATGVFMVSHCACGCLSFPPRRHCPRCGSAPMGWQRVSGLGKVYSQIVVHAAAAYFAADAPYSLVVVDLEEGVRLVTRWHGDPPQPDDPARLLVASYEDGVLFGACSA